MWVVSGTNLQITKGDYGLALPITLSGAELSASDQIEIRFKNNKTGKVFLKKNLTPVDNIVELEFSEEETQKFAVGSYSYAMDWYQNGRFMCNVISSANLKVVSKV